MYALLRLIFCCYSSIPLFLLLCYFTEAFAKLIDHKYLRLMLVNLLLGTEQSTAAENKKKKRVIQY